MKVSTEKLEDNKAKLTIELPAEEFEKSMDKVFRQVVKRINIHGFRKGKAPRHLVERMYGREILLEDAINNAVPEAFTQAIQDVDRQFECIGYPSYDIVSSEKGEGLVFTATYDLKPEIKLGGYKGMALEKLPEAVEDDAVEKQLAAMRDRYARLEVSEDPAATGDICTIDFLGRIGGEPFEGGEGKDHNLELGSNSFIPGFEDQLVGARAGDETEVAVAFPEDYRVAELAGKEAVFAVTVKEVKHKVLSDMDDEFAKDVSEFETMDELRKDLEGRLRREAESRARADLEAKALDKAIEAAEMELADSIVAFRQDQLLETFANQMQRQGVPFEKYLEYANSTQEEVREGLKDRAIRELKTELVLEAIAAAEGIAVDDSALDEEYQRLAEQTGKTSEEIKALYEGNKTMAESLKFSLNMNKTITFLTENANITESTITDQTV